MFSLDTVGDVTTDGTEICIDVNLAFAPTRDERLETQRAASPPADLFVLLRLSIHRSFPRRSSLFHVSHCCQVQNTQLITAELQETNKETKQ